MSKMDSQKVFKTPNPYKQLAETLKDPESVSKIESQVPAESVASFQSSSVMSKLNDHLSIHTGKFFQNNSDSFRFKNIYEALK